MLYESKVLSAGLLAGSIVKAQPEHSSCVDRNRPRSSFGPLDLDKARPLELDPVLDHQILMVCSGQKV